MDKDTLIKYKAKTQNFGTEYRERLVKLRNDSKYACFYDVIDFMLENNIRLEQESMI